jgi:hypothetical protein
MIKKMLSAKLHGKKDMRRAVSLDSHFVADEKVILGRKLHPDVS